MNNTQLHIYVCYYYKIINTKKPVWESGHRRYSVYKKKSKNFTAYTKSREIIVDEDFKNDDSVDEKKQPKK